MSSISYNSTFNKALAPTDQCTESNVRRLHYSSVNSDYFSHFIHVRRYRILASPVRCKTWLQGFPTAQQVELVSAAFEEDTPLGVAQGMHGVKVAGLNSWVSCV